MKNILIISASPRKNGRYDILCDRFAEGAREAGVIYGVVAWAIGEIKVTPAYNEAYEMGRRIS